MASDVPTGTLISFDDDDSLNKPSINEPKDVKEKPKEDDISTKESSKSKLCGYLDKLGAKGLIRAFKTRWFIYEPRRCQLYYYRTPQDLAPLGSIDIANATFTFDLNNTEKMGQFNIVTKNRVYQLQAKDNATMMYWLQELQERRRDYSRIRTCQSRDSNVASVS
uniref:TBC1 domain family member 2B-like n=1 Tax=Saccoglossus kowalevskii TaxID=10224 RepID=A0ABM0MAQ5_SACKO